MIKANINGRSRRRTINSNWFTGKTWMRTISDVIESTGHDVHHVHFESGSRTKLHTHNGNQMLIVTGGKGSLEMFEKLPNAAPPAKKHHNNLVNESQRHNSKALFAIKKTKTIRLLEGDVVHVPSGTLHTHGSVDDAVTFSHIAINILPNKKNTEYKTVWYESDFKKSVYGVI